MMEEGVAGLVALGNILISHQNWTEPQYMLLQIQRLSAWKYYNGSYTITTKRITRFQKCIQNKHNASNIKTSKTILWNSELYKRQWKHYICNERTIQISTGWEIWRTTLKCRISTKSSNNSAISGLAPLFYIEILDKSKSNILHIHAHRLVRRIGHAPRRPDDHTTGVIYQFDRHLVITSRQTTQTLEGCRPPGPPVD